ncbi:MAG: N-acyl amino acid synthase FeeM domain-containing protein, partial [Longimicrobiales bacterium]
GATLIAAEREAIVGTLTLSLDGPDGLAADGSYGDAVDAVRRAGRDVCELTRLALSTDADSRSVLCVLFGAAYLLGRRLHSVTDVFVEVNPRHVGFYRALFGFAVAAGQRVCPRVMAPAVLLRLEIEGLEARLADTEPGARSLVA